jgi:TniQ
MDQSLARFQPMPDELDRGYIARLAFGNGLSSKRLLNALRSARKSSTEDQVGMPSAVELVCTVAKMTSEAFAHAHTSLPLRRAFSFDGSTGRHGRLSLNNVLLLGGMRPMRAGAYLCKACVLEDRSFHGFSYWRREHQIRGVWWCLKHGDALWHLPDESAFERAPSAAVHEATAIDEDLCAQAKQNRFVARAIDLACALMSLRSEQPIRTIAGRLRLKGIEKGLHVTHEARVKPLLSDLVERSFPSAWVQEFHPPMREKVGGSFIHSVDGTVRESELWQQVWPFLLAASVLYDSTDEAMRALSPSGLHDQQGTPQAAASRLIDA